MGAFGDSPVVLLASGTRGDVQPFVALALGLRDAGIPTLVAAASRFRPFVEARGIRFAPLAGNPSDLMADGSDSMAASLRGGAVRGMVSTARFLRAAQADYRRMLESAAAACRPARAIIAGLSSTWGASIAEARGVPCVLCMLQPFSRTRAFSSALLPVRIPLGAAFNTMSYRIIEQAMWLPWRRTTNAWRRQTLGLPSLPAAGPWAGMYHGGFPCVYGYSPVVVPPPGDWPPGHVVTGYWFLDAEPAAAASPELETFLAAGEPPLFIGFGSMGMSFGRQGLRSVEQALQLSGLRAVVSVGGLDVPGIPRAASSRILFFEDVPHSWLFPRVAAVVHHGGAGTTAEALRAGRPSIVFPVAADQHFWAERIVRLGAGPRTDSRNLSSPHAMARLFARTAADAAMKNRARRFGEKIRAENGVSRAIEALFPLLGSNAPRLSRRFPFSPTP
jgi:sterol 3beta-glucosyltransferase